MLHAHIERPVCVIEDLIDADAKPAIVGIIKNARFLNIGDGKIVIAGTIYNHRDVRDGSTFYSEPLLNDDGYVAGTEAGNFAYSRTI